MGEIVNLKRVRKQKARDDKDASAAQNRALFGRTRAERQKAEADKALAERSIDAHKRES